MIKNIKSNRKLIVSFALMAVAVVMIVVLMAVILSDTARVEAKEAGELRFESVLIGEGESLWSVAGEYKGEGEKTAAFVKKLAELNGIGADQKLYAGRYRLVPVSR